MKKIRKKILFFTESATLSHIVRPWLLAQSLDKDKYEVIFAHDKLPDFVEHEPTEVKKIQLKYSN